MSDILTMYKDMGNKTFSDTIAQFAPYFSTIDPEFVELKPQYAELILKNQKKVHNHLGTVHAIAMCNAAELVAGMTTDVSIPAGARWIPQGMTVEYLAKAKTDLVVKCEAQEVDFKQAGVVVVPVSAYDNEGQKCFSAMISMNVKHN
tara:strand:- start:124 stop:564 length:441 start_codon:yes stop_codon:yes gene_type:complete